MISRLILAAQLSIVVYALGSASPSPSALSPQDSASNGSKSNGYEARAETLYRQSLELTDQGRYRVARLMLFEAVALWETSRQIEQATDALLQMADQSNSAGRWQDALEYYRRLLNLAPLADQVKVKALRDAARLYGRLRQFDLATDHYQQSLRLARQKGKASDQALALIGLAWVYNEAGQVEQSDALLEKARAIEWSEGDELSQAAMLWVAGRIYQSRKQAAKALETLEQSLTLYRKVDGNRSDESMLLSDISNLRLASGDKPSALDYAMQAIKKAEGLKAAEPGWRSLLALARALRALSRPRDALTSYLRAFSLVEKQSLYISADSLKISFLEDRQNLYREMVHILIEMDRPDEAFKIAEHSRSRATLDLLAGARRGEGKPGTPEQKKALEEISKTISRLRTEMRSPQIDGKRQSALQVEIEEAQLRREEIRLETEIGRVKRFTAPATLARIQESVLGPDDLLIQFFLAESSSYAWVVTEKNSSCFSLPGREEIEKEVKSYIEMISSKPSNMHLNRELYRQKERANRMFDLLLGNFRERLSPGRRLIIIPDGLLNYLPFETLIFEGRYLIENHVISYAPSASILSMLKQSEKNREPSERIELLAFGDPTFESSSYGGYPLPPLSNTRDEVLSIVSFFPSGQGRNYLGKEATEDRLKREPLNKYRRLHLATHSLIDENAPSRSGVVLALDDDPTEDGFLEVGEIADLELNCDLVVLSACQTGRGLLVRGEGLLGLTRSFLYAGARSVVVSLWNVSDLSTTRFMKDFYRRMAAKTVSPEALRQSKIEMLASGKAMSHPYYWAPFVIVGVTQEND